MQYLSFGADAGHLACRVARVADVREVRPSVFSMPSLHHPDILELLWEAADGHWIVEWLPVDQEPDTGAGATVQLRVLSQDLDGRPVLHGMAADTTPVGGPVRTRLADIERIHIF